MDIDLDWRRQLAGAATDAQGLGRALALTDDERSGVEEARRLGFPPLATPYYLSLVDPADPDDPIRRQLVPSAREAVAWPGDLVDPLGEEGHVVAPLLVRRYPDRALLLATDRCATHCRHCTRRRRVGRGRGPASLDELEPAMRWLEGAREVREVLVSGGDPLVAEDAWLDGLLGRLRRIEHVELVRVGTRTPVTLPQRIDRSLASILRRHAPIFVTTHFNHPREMTDAARRACAELIDVGVPVENQAVLLRGVNDCARIQIDLSRALLRARVRPYYLMQADPVSGTGHLRVGVRRGLELIRAMRGRVSGLGVPTYVLDIPGGIGKVPLTPSYVTGARGATLLLEGPRGGAGEYVDLPSDAARCEGCVCAGGSDPSLDTVGALS